MQYFEEQTKQADYPHEFDHPEAQPQRTVSHRLALLEEQFEKLGAAVDSVRSDIDHLKGVIG